MKYFASVSASLAGIFKKLKALDVSLITYNWKKVSSLIPKKDIKTLVIFYKAVIYQEMASLIWFVQRSHTYVYIMTSFTNYEVVDLYMTSVIKFDMKMFVSG